MLAFKPGQEGSVNERSCEDNEGAVAVKVCTRLKDASNWNKRDRRMGGCGYEGTIFEFGISRSPGAIPGDNLHLGLEV